MKRTAALPPLPPGPPLPSAPPARGADCDELGRVQRELAAISQSLVASYQALSARYERVERELSLANAELERRLSERDALSRHLEAILHALPTGVVVRDAAGVIRSANDAALSILGVQASELVGTRTHPALRGEHADGSARELVRADGERLVLASRHAAVLGPVDGRGERGGSVEILDDRTEVTALGERLHAMDKMAALGTMAGGIAHEIRNPLSAVGGFAALLLRELEPGTRAHRWASLIVAGAAETNAIITSMQTLASPEGLVLEAIDGDELLASAVESALADDATVGASPTRWRIERRASSPPFQGDRIKLRQALRNLVANAIQAQPEGGALRVSLSRVAGDLELEVADAGPGIPPASAQRVLDPFYTTRARGTGLGLALVSSIAQLHGGAVRVRPEHGPLGGAAISILIPFHPALSAAVAPCPSNAS